MTAPQHDSPEAADPTVYLKSAGPTADGFVFEFQSNVIPILAEHLAEQFKAAGGENYVSFEIDHKDLGPLILRIQRRSGETPEKQAQDRAAEITTLRHRLAALESELARLRQVPEDAVEAAARAAVAWFLHAGAPASCHLWDALIPETREHWCATARAALAAATPAMRAEVRKAALEEAAGVCGDFSTWARKTASEDGVQVAQAWAAAVENVQFKIRALAAQPQPEAPRWRHKKRGTTYTEIGRASLQTATGSVSEPATLVIYRGEDGKLWAREEGEFEDGRFERAQPKAQS